jgi:hypothetical protein
LITVKVSCTDHKYSILGKSFSEDLIPEDQTKLRKEFQKVKEAKKEGKWTIIRNQKTIVRDRHHKDNNK